MLFDLYHGGTISRTIMSKLILEFNNYTKLKKLWAYEEEALQKRMDIGRGNNPIMGSSIPQRKRKQ